ncbi:MAG: RDD family protein [Ignavibacteria bacterium]|nr:RDD family protein [Ignavibacteria bacterium]
MKTYYTVKDGKKQGPFTMAELQAKSLPSQTDLWSEYEKDWFPVKAIPELRDFIIYDSDDKEDKHFGYRLATLKERFWEEVLNEIFYIILYLVFYAGAEFFKSKLNSYNVTADGTLILYSLGAIQWFFFGIGVLFAFRCIFYAFFSGTLGHRLMGIKVINASDGTDCKKFSKCFWRETIKLILNYFVILNAWLLFDKNNQNIYDKIVKTYVVKRIKYDEVI